MLSSFAAACSSKLKDLQKRLRSARPQPRLMRLPKGEWMTTCMSPTSSKKRSMIIVSRVGIAPSAAIPACRYSTTCDAAECGKPTALIHHCIAASADSSSIRSPICCLKLDTDCDSSTVRPGPSPNQKGTVGFMPWASLTRTLSPSTRKICQA